jgi:hypothetical protein
MRLDSDFILILSYLIPSGSVSPSTDDPDPILILSVLHPSPIQELTGPPSVSKKLGEVLCPHSCGVWFFRFIRNVLGRD